MRWVSVSGRRMQKGGTSPLDKTLWEAATMSLLHQSLYSVSASVGEEIVSGVFHFKLNRACSCHAF